MTWQDFAGGFAQPDRAEREHKDYRVEEQTLL